MGIGLFLSFLETKWLYPLYYMGYGIKGLRASLFVGGNHGIVFREDSAEVYLLWPLV